MPRTLRPYSRLLKHRRTRKRVFAVLTVAQQYEQSVGGTITPAGALSKQTSKFFTGVLTAAGDLVAALIAIVIPIHWRRHGRRAIGKIFTIPVIQRQRKRRFFQAPVTAYTQDLSGTLTMAGTLVRMGMPMRAGTLTTSGSLFNQTGKALDGAFTPIGTLLKSTSHFLDGTVSFAGALAAVRTVIVSLTGAFTPTGTLLKQTSKVLAGTLTTAGALVKQTTHLLTGTLTLAGAFAGSIIGSLVPIPFRRRRLRVKPWKPTPVRRRRRSRLVAFTSGTEYTQSVSGTITPTGSLTKRTARSFTGTVSFAGSIIRQHGKVLVATLVTAGSLIKLTSHFLTGTLTTAGALSSLRVIQRSFEGTITPTGAKTESITKSVGGSITPTGTVNKHTTKTMAGTITPTSTVSGTIPGPGGASGKSRFRWRFRRY